ncbi:uncharacterized protein LOC106095358 isoform X2 [Stomoxys calcitrans]|uniref:Uncharacterized protein n=1 Tax=Stomoxys calcitrans TaxID=35570 RepID=A0A1I8P1G9_STOCA|nr:uncharacterized protein LOC106095358 isoform X2 [Stomoxys calcitrans]
MIEEGSHEKLISNCLKIQESGYTKEITTTLNDDNSMESHVQCDKNGQLSNATGEDEQSYNNHHIVPIGLLIVFATIYLGMSSLPRCFVNCAEKNILRTTQTYPHPENIKGAQNVLDRLLEYKDICKDLAIFTKDINKTQHEENKTVSQKQSLLDFAESSGDTVDGGSGRGDKCSKAYTKVNKFTKTDKKDAEPIIYLFALVFIYLLLKAASDINQHYKSENKNDKRFLRRCSLQSYAQTHRDRRASKEQKRTVASSSSSRRDTGAEQQYYYHNLEMSSSQKTPTPPPPPLSPLPGSGSGSGNHNWQLLRQRMTLSLDNSNSLSPLTKPELSVMMQRRRCSVPASTFHQQRHNSKNPLGLLSDSLERRTSITMPLVDSVDMLGPETTKRRVRMINRH